MHPLIKLCYDRENLRRLEPPDYSIRYRVWAVMMAQLDMLIMELSHG